MSISIAALLADVGYQSNWSEILSAGFMRNAFVGGSLVALASVAARSRACFL